MFSCGLYQLTEVETAIHDAIATKGLSTFMQIGANDGYRSDPLNLAIFLHGLHGVFVEPQQHYCEQLKKTYANFEGLQFVQCAIAEKRGQMKIFSLDCSSGSLPPWASEVGTLSREQILQFKDQIPNIENYILVSEVDCITVAELLESSQFHDPDIIVIDAEGYDYQILSQFNFQSLSTKVVVFETQHLPEERRLACVDQLKAANFVVATAGGDAIAVRRGTKSM